MSEYNYMNQDVKPLNLSSSNKNHIPVTVQDLAFHQEERSHFTSDELGKIDVRDLIGSNPNTIEQSLTIKTEDDMETEPCIITEDKDRYPTNSLTGAPLYPSLGYLSSGEQPKEHEFILKLSFRNQVVSYHHIKNPGGVRICHGLPLSDMLEDDKKKVYGPSDAQTIEFPINCFNGTNEQFKLTQKLLESLDRGITLQIYDGKICAMRKCRVVVFVSTPEVRNPFKIQRDNNTVLFDYETFIQALRKYRLGFGPKPSAEILLGFGQSWTNTLDPYSNLLLSATIYHPQAIYELSRDGENGMLTPPFEISNSDEIDKYLKIYQSLIT